MFTLYITLFDLDMKTVESLLDVVTRVHFQAKKENENCIFFKKINKSIFKRMRRETADFLLFMDDVKNDQNVFGLGIA